MQFPEDIRYTKDHEWVRVTGSAATVGITEFAQSELGDVVFVDLPQVGKTIAAKGVLCVVESTKAASDVYAPVSGTVTEVNSVLTSTPETINREPYGAGWIAKVTLTTPAEVEALLTATQYAEYLKSKGVSL